MKSALAGWAGLVLGPLLWFAAQQVSVLLTTAQCRGRPWLIPALTGAAAALLFARALWAPRPAPAAGAAERQAFMRRLGTLSCLVFGVTLLWQCVAALSYGGCEQ